MSEINGVTEESQTEGSAIRILQYPVDNLRGIDFAAAIHVRSSQIGKPSCLTPAVSGGPQAPTHA